MLNARTRLRPIAGAAVPACRRSFSSRSLPPFLRTQPLWKDKWNDKNLWNEFYYKGKVGPDGHLDMIPDRYKHLDFRRLEEEVDRVDHAFFADDYEKEPIDDSYVPLGEGKIGAPEETLITKEDYNDFLVNVKKLSTVQDPQKTAEEQFWMWLFEVETYSRQRITDSGRVATSGCLLLGGNGQGAVSYGYGRGVDPKTAHEKAMRNMRRNLIFVPLQENRTIWQAVTGKHNRTRVVMRPVPRNGGLVAGELIDAILTSAGVLECSTKIHGTRNPFSIIYAAFDALSQQRSSREMAIARGMNYYKWYVRGQDPPNPPTREELLQQRETASELILEATNHFMEMNKVTDAQSFQMKVPKPAELLDREEAQWAAELMKREKDSKDTLLRKQKIGHDAFDELDVIPDDPLWWSLKPEQRVQMLELFRQQHKLMVEKYGKVNDMARELVRKRRAADAEKKVEEGKAEEKQELREKMGLTEDTPVAPPRIAPRIPRRISRRIDGPIAEGTRMMPEQEETVEEPVEEDPEYKDIEMVEYYDVKDIVPEEEDLVKKIADMMYESATEETDSYYPDKEMDHMQHYVKHIDDMQEGLYPPQKMGGEPPTVNRLKSFRFPDWLKDQLEDGEWKMYTRPLSTKWPPEAPAPLP